jgi:hypothetical protein
MSRAKHAENVVLSSAFDAFYRDFERFLS